MSVTRFFTIRFARRGDRGFQTAGPILKLVLSNWRRSDEAKGLLLFATFRAALKLARAVLLNVLNDEASAAFGTGLRNRLISQREFASRIVRTAVKRSALALLGHYFPGPALGTAHASCLLLDVFALRI